ncbi:DUF190 domain-containing protein [Pseudodesulfovibrio sp. zrk46]|uniref:DUF190 domain-containing protein n=1 Tax=Pseudodesulfovibrio sp. zrk46 TaxID=2725288 RepID=UPI001448CA25|nr:DUF190 domain-containing protein [Pseudodesulfovibrio sp. zrk46]QJB56648.1 DUF190 domain-containing protein [Pseudodesulfovibrio sp. zrk46]
MQGYFITLFTQQNRKHEGIPLAKWIIEEAKKLGIGGATLFSGKEGFGHDGRFHSDNYFDLEDPPLQVAMALTPEECDKLIHRIEESQVRIFYTKSPIEFGFTANNSSAN